MGFTVFCQRGGKMNYLHAIIYCFFIFFAILIVFYTIRRTWIFVKKLQKAFAESTFLAEWFRNNIIGKIFDHVLQSRSI